MIVQLHIPKGSSIQVKKGQKVKFGEPFYSTTQETHVEIAIDKQLGIKPKDIFKCIKVVVGDELKKGDVLAEKKKFIGKKVVKSKHSARVSNINHESGMVVLSTTASNASQQTVFFTGEIADIHDDTSLVDVEIGSATEYQAKAREDFGGECICIDDKDFYAIDSDTIKDRIILVHTVQSHIATKVEALDAKGIVFVKGSLEIDLPHAKLASEDEYKKLTQDKHEFVVFASTSQKGFTYN